MGYSAPSAEEVYRYIFRLDHARGGLSDGFSWTILFLNDGSESCKEFLGNYGAELCYRTAERVRFVFFSGLSPEETRELIVRQAEANAGPRSRSRASKGGLLSNIIEAATRWEGWTIGQPRFDWERDPWELKRPRAFHPLDSEEKINRQLDFEGEVKSAIPGAGEPFRLAQRLGVGRFVPCFLLFSDIGNPVIYVYPVGKEPPERIIQRLRRWIDSFYEVNHSTLKRWAEIEKSIEEMGQALRLSLTKVDAWKREQESRWHELQRLSRVLDRLDPSPPSKEIIKGYSTDYRLSWEARNLFTSLNDQLELIDRKGDQVQNLADWAQRLRCSQDPRSILGELSSPNNRAAMPPSVVNKVKFAIQLFTSSPKSEFPDSELTRWWRTEHGRPPSRNRHKHYRAAWAHYSKLKHGDNAIGRTSEILKEEFAVICNSALGQPVSWAAEPSARSVIEELANYLGVSSQDATWNDNISEYQQFLAHYFADLKQHAPPWLVSLGSQISSVLSWRDCIPSHELRSLVELNKCLEQLPRLHELIQRVRDDWAYCAKEIEKQMRVQQGQCVNELISELESGASSSDLFTADRQAVWLAFTASLAGMRQDMEDKVLGSAKLIGKASFPANKISRDDVSRLLKLLDEYDKAVDSLKLPFADDQDVLRLAFQTSLPEAFGVACNIHAKSKNETIKNDLLKAAQEVERSVDGWANLRQDSTNWSPAGNLYSALSQAISPERLTELLPDLAHKRVLNPSEVLSTRADVVLLLNSLTIQELLSLERIVFREAGSDARSSTSTKTELHETILVAIGFSRHIVNKSGLAEASKVLREKVSRGVFDVFLAHNSRDKAEVMKLGDELRRQGIYPWIDVEQIPPGRWFQDVIQSAVRAVKVAVVVIGGSGLGRWQALELRTFISRSVEAGVPVIPVLLPGVAAVPEELAFLRELNTVRFKHDVTEQDQVARLIWGITGEKPTSVNLLNLEG